MAAADGGDNAGERNGGKWGRDSSRIHPNKHICLSIYLQINPTAGGERRAGAGAGGGEDRPESNGPHAHHRHHTDAHTDTNHPNLLLPILRRAHGRRHRRRRGHGGLVFPLVLIQLALSLLLLLSLLLVLTEGHEQEIGALPAARALVERNGGGARAAAVDFLELLGAVLVGLWLYLG